MFGFGDFWESIIVNSREYIERREDSRNGEE
jgi:hypothetical protein